MHSKNCFHAIGMLITLLCLFYSTGLYAQVDTAWVRRYNAPANAHEYARAIAVDGTGNVYVSGNSANNANWPYDYDYLTVKYDTDGDTVWVRTYAGPGAPEYNDDYALAIAADDAGNAYVTGHSPGPDNIDDIVTIKYLPDGDTAWVRRYNGPGNDVDCGNAIAVDDAGNVYVTGYSYSTATSDDYLTIKYDPDGNIAWLITYNGPAGDGGDYANALALDTAANVYITGRSFGGWPPSGMDDYLTIKYVQSPGIEENRPHSTSNRVFLNAIYPNPFEGLTQINYGVPREMRVNISIYSALGQLIKTLVDETKTSGNYAVNWNGTDNSGRKVPGGAYFVRLTTDQVMRVEKSILIK